jgi:hypothetical protein
MSGGEALSDAWTFLIHNRGSLPPVRTTISWPDMAVIANANPTYGYPLTKKFVLEAWRRDKLQFLLGRPRPTDPATASIEVIQQDLDALRQSERFIPAA